MGSGDNVPGATGQGACGGARHVVDEMCNDNLDNLLGESCGMR
jgi:hypothetical protein